MEKNGPMLANRKHLVNSVKRTYTVSVLLPKGETAMHDIDEIRRKAMGVLEKEAGGPVAAAKRADMSHSQIFAFRY